jgi:Tol biopolymer transport system component
LIRDILTNPKFSFVFLVGCFLFALTGCVSVPTPTITPIPTAANIQNTAFPTITPTLTAIPTKIRPTLTVTPTLYPAGNGKIIAFYSLIMVQDDVREGFISIVNVNNHLVTRLPARDIFVSEAVWSPDGRHIAYTVPKANGESEELYLMNANGTNQVLIEKECHFPEWSPNGLFIACMVYSFNDNISTIIIDLATKNKSSGPGRTVVWSPDSQNFAFTVKNGDKITNIFIQNVSGDGKPIQLTSSQSYDIDPKWSPDGKYILFSSDRTGSEQIYIMNADGSHEYALTTGDKPNSQANWSPDGTKIVFVSLRHEKDLSKCPYFNNPCNSEIYVMNADGSNQTRLTNNPGEDSEPDWSPDGKYVAFVSYRDEPNFKKCKFSCNSEIYIVGVNGEGLTRLTNNQTYDHHPAWQPKP